MNTKNIAYSPQANQTLQRICGATASLRPRKTAELIVNEHEDDNEGQCKLKTKGGKNLIKCEQEGSAPASSPLCDLDNLVTDLNHFCDAFRDIFICHRWDNSHSPWDERKVFNRISLKADKLIGGTGQTGLLIDETYFAKKGKMSVGVARQWNGRLEKTENSQVAVFGALSAGERADSC